MHFAEPTQLLCSYENRVVIADFCCSSVKMSPYTGNKKSVDFLLQAYALKHWPFYWLWHKLPFACCLLPSKRATISADGLTPRPRQKRPSKQSDVNISSSPPHWTCRYIQYIHGIHSILLSHSLTLTTAVFGLPFAGKYKHRSVFVCWSSSVLEGPLSHFLMASWLSAFGSLWAFPTKQCILGHVAETTSLCAASA